MNHLHHPHSQIWGIRAEEGQEDGKWKRLGGLVRSRILGTWKGCFVDIFIEAVLLALGNASQHYSTDHEEVHETPCCGGTRSTWGKEVEVFLPFFSLKCYQIFLYLWKTFCLVLYRIFKIGLSLFVSWCLGFSVCLFGFSFFVVVVLLFLVILVINPL